MEKLKVAILGASGIGKFHARDFSNAGCDVCAILGSSKESSIKTAEMLKEKFRINAKPYYEIEELLKEKLDAAAICTPPLLHEEQARKCLQRGLHVLCEKPFVFNKNYQGYEITKKLFESAERKGKILTVNTQWPCILENLEKYIEINKIREFSMYMEPGTKGIGLITEMVPHMNSMLIRLVPGGKATNIDFLVLREDEIKVRFDYDNGKNNCKVEYDIRFKADRPRAVVFNINKHMFERAIGDNYQQFLLHGNEKIVIPDPFSGSINKFIAATSGAYSPLISEEEILENVKLQDEIIKMYLAQAA